jgi:thiol:disulfide interchange protein
MSPLPIRHIPAVTLVILCGTALAQSSPSAGQSAAAQQGGIDAVLKAAKGSPNDPLPVDQAFRLDAMAQGSDRVRLNWEIAEGDYLYRSRIKITTSSTSAQLGTPQFPAGQIKNDEYFGRQEIYHHELSVIVPIARGRSGTVTAAAGDLSRLLGAGRHLLPAGDQADHAQSDRGSERSGEGRDRGRRSPA